MKWTQMPLGAIQTNCYIIENDNKEALIIDPGDEFNKLKAYIDQHAFKPRAVILTHAHFDHIGALSEVREQWKIPVYLHQNEEDWLGDPDKNGSAHFPMVSPYRLQPADFSLSGEETLNIGSFSFQTFETPGHSPGSLSLYFEEESVLFAGDTLFNGSIGRTDLYGGDPDLLIKSIKDKILTLPDETIVAPGHGFETSVGHEKATNPFLLT